MGIREIIKDVRDGKYHDRASGLPRYSKMHGDLVAAGFDGRVIDVLSEMKVGHKATSAILEAYAYDIESKDRKEGA